MSTFRLVRHSRAERWSQRIGRAGNEDRRPEREERQVEACISGTTSGRTSRRNWTFHVSPRVKPAKPEGKRPNRAGRSMNSKTQLTRSDEWRKYVSEKICWRHCDG